ncbi:carbohydrate-binding family 9-like protein [Mangrovibacterium marinum]|uniref:Cellulose/xylan binding protein with CBM9 domain n=1 Tax=Mangrovibacterium marinum TaxID=1639118 RepID=A0A2T5BXW1_9BACT|nr:carbohydrate-binding family 9-like protein [Mangrovibacterium marinum]PTN06284.1 cellulose/xylan binding protein with CBM9 domain [Mangrovibacterium marinum]
MKVPFIDYQANTAAELTAALVPVKATPIAIFSWDEQSPKPDVQFKIAHNNEAILLQYQVRESELIARYSHNNEPVYKDSCVEFFVSFTGGKDYYNLEFNSLGTCLGGYGPERQNRERLSADTLRQIKLQSTISRNSAEQPDCIEWQLNILIPASVFQHTPIDTLAGLKADANFYKCGDELSQPHYLSWKKIDTPTPDFHQPPYFGKIEFEG